MRHILKLFLPLLFLVISAQSQQHIGQWKSFTDMKSVRGAVLVDHNIWAATGGGVFVFDTTNGTFTKFTNVDGLDTNDVLSIAFDGTHDLWVGGAGGWINVYDMNAHQWQTIADIANKTESSYKGIHSFSFKGDTVFIVTDFGVSLFRRSRWEFGDTYQNIGFTSPHVSCMALQQNRMWIGTDKGLAVSSLGSSLWSTYNSFPGVTSSVVTALVVYNDTLVIGTSTGAVYFAQHDNAPKALPLLSNRSVQELRVVQGKLSVLSTSGQNFTVETLASVLDRPQTIISNSDVQGICIIPTSSPWIGTASRGLAHGIGPTWSYTYPNGPNSNFFSSIAVDADGMVWCTPGEISGAGFYRYNASLPDDRQWKNFTNGDYHKVSLGTKGSVWISSWGDGIIEVVGDSIRRKLSYNFPPYLPGADATIPNYVVGGGAATDDQGKIWITTRSNSGNKTLLRLDSDTDIVGTFYDNIYSNFHDIIVDHNGTKWIATTVPWKMESKGLIYFNENKTVSGTQNTDGWGQLSTDDGLLSDIVLCVAMDLDGTIWAGLGLGVVIILDPLNPVNRSTSFPLREQVIQSIAVDAVNNKWIGTKEGVFVVNADGTQLVQNPLTVPSANPITVSSTNKSLLSNDVRTIDIDQKRGIVYFGTEQGLSSLAINPVQTSRSFSELLIGPNPYILPNDQMLTIRNLIANSTIKVLTVSGTVVAQFDAQGGGRAFWDGRDKKGAFVSSGIYFIVAFAENGKQTVTGKVAVIRH